MSNNAVVGVEPWGGRSRAIIFDHTGPSSYPVGGEILGQSQYGGPNLLGLSGYDLIPSALSDSGNYRVDCVYGGPGVRQFVKLKWTTASTGAEVTAATDLSGEMVRLLAIGG